MRLNYNKKRPDPTVYIIESVYLCGKKKTRTVEKLGRMSELKKQYDDPIAHFQEVIKKMTEEAKDKKKADLITVEFNPNVLIEKDIENRYYAGHLFVNKIYYNLGLPEFCKKVANKHRFEFDLNGILSYIINATYVSPDSKLGIFSDKDMFIDAPDFSLKDLYRSLDYIASHSDLLQSELYKASKKLVTRDTSILFYDCTNYYFEIELPDPDVIENEKVVKKGKRSFGHCKRNSKKPITSFGLFMDASGIPLAFTTFPGGQNEQKTLRPLEKQIVKDFQLSKFIVCTDAGLTSFQNKKYNTNGKRSYITTQHLSGMMRESKKEEKEEEKKKKKKKKKETDPTKLKNLNIVSKKDIVAWALEKTGWYYRVYDTAAQCWTTRDINLSKITADDWGGIYAQTIFYKDRIFKYQTTYTNDEGESKVGILEERFVVTYCEKRAIRSRTLRDKLVERAKKMTKKKVLKEQLGSAAKYVKEENYTKEGEVIGSTQLSLSQEAIDEDAKYDGFYCVTTNLFQQEERDGYKIVAITKRRWEIEESFLILQKAFRTRPIHLRLEQRIDAHLIIHFIALLIYRIMEKKICKFPDEFSYYQIIDCLRSIQLHKQKDQGFSPSFKRTDLVDRLCEVFDIELRTEIMRHKDLHEEVKKSKS